MPSEMALNVEVEVEVEVEVDGEKRLVRAGICVAAALLRLGNFELRQSPKGNPRGAYCMMGVCQECVVRIDGRIRQACLTPVHPGMLIETGRRS